MNKKELSKIEDRWDGCWIINKFGDDEIEYICSVCEFELMFIEGDPTSQNYNYCPKCGSQLLEVKDA